VASALQREKGQVPLFAFEAPITLRIEFQSTSMADLACLMPYTKRVDGRTVEYTDNDYAIVFEAIMALVTLAFVTTI
jgi:D-amino peptidase